MPFLQIYLITGVGACPKRIFTVGLASCMLAGLQAMSKRGELFKFIRKIIIVS